MKLVLLEQRYSAGCFGSAAQSCRSCVKGFMVNVYEKVQLAGGVG